MPVRLSQSAGVDMPVRGTLRPPFWPRAHYRVRGRPRHSVIRRPRTSQPAARNQVLRSRAPCRALSHDPFIGRLFVADEGVQKARPDRSPPAAVGSHVHIRRRDPSQGKSYDARRARDSWQPFPAPRREGACDRFTRWHFRADPAMRHLLRLLHIRLTVLLDK